MRRSAAAVAAAASAASVLLWPVSAPATRESTCLPGRQSAVLVAYTRTGGLAGLRDAITVYRGGRAHVVRHRPGPGSWTRLSCVRLRALATALERARFSTLAPVYAPDNPIADGFIESVRYRGRTVRVLGGGTPPARLARALSPLRALASGEE